MSDDTNRDKLALSRIVTQARARQRVVTTDGFTDEDYIDIGGEVADAILAEFLAEHDRLVAEKAWDEGRNSLGADHGVREPSTNPYRRTPGEDT